MGCTVLLSITVAVLFTAIQPAHLQYAVQYYTTEHVNEPFDIRLVDGPTALEGRLEVHHDGFWGTVCDRNTKYIQFHVAEVVCRNLGYDTAIEVKPDAFYGEGSGDIILSDVSCDGSEQLLSQCSHLYWGNGNCRSNEAFGVRCTNVKDGEIPIHLGDYHNKYKLSKGIIKAFYNGTWGNICFKYDQWGLSEANVACRQLGFSAGAISPYNEYEMYADDSEFVISHVSCTGTEDNLDMCTVRGIDVKETGVFFTTPWYDWRWVTEGPPVCPGGTRSGVICNNSETGLSDGKIAGVVVASTLLVIMLVALPLIIVRCKKPKDHGGGDTASTDMPSTMQAMSLPQSQSMDLNSTRATAQVSLPSGSPAVAYGQNGRIIYTQQAISMQQAMNSQLQFIAPVIVSPTSAACYASNVHQPLMSNTTALNTADSKHQNECNSSNEESMSANMEGVDFKDQTPLIST